MSAALAEFRPSSPIGRDRGLKILPGEGSTPSTGIEDERYGYQAFCDDFKDEVACVEFLLALRVSDPCEGCGAVGALKYYAVQNAPRSAHCTRCRKTICLTKGTPMYRSSLPLSVWFEAIYLLVSSRGAMPQCDLQRILDVTQKTAAKMRAEIGAILGFGSSVRLDKDEIRRMKRRGLASKDVASAMNCTPEYVNLVWRTRDDPPKPKRRTRSDVSRLVGGSTSPRVVRRRQNIREAVDGRRAENRWTVKALREQREALRTQERVHRQAQREVQKRIDKETDRAASSFLWNADSLDRFRDDEAEDKRSDVPTVMSADAEFQHVEYAARLRAIVGDMDPDDVQRMTAWDLERLRDRLTDEGFRPPGVQRSERDRLRDPNRHAGGSIPKTGRKGGSKRTRAQQQQVTHDHHVRDLPNAAKKQHSQLRKQRRERV